MSKSDNPDRFKSSADTKQQNCQLKIFSIRLCFDILMVLRGIIVSSHRGIFSFVILYKKKERHFCDVSVIKFWCSCDFSLLEAGFLRVYVTKFLFSRQLVSVEIKATCVRTWSQLFSGNYRKKRVEMKRVRIKKPHKITRNDWILLILYFWLLKTHHAVFFVG